MSGEIITTVIGNLTAAPEVFYTQKGEPVATFTVAHTDRRFDKNSNQWVDGQATFIRCSAWRKLAEESAALKKGDRVIVYGTLQQRDYETREGEKRSSMELTAEEIGESIRFRSSRERSGDAPVMAGQYGDDTPF